MKIRKKSSPPEIYKQNILDQALFRRTRVFNVLSNSGVLVGEDWENKEKAEADWEMEEERHEERRLRIIGEWEPGIIVELEPGIIGELAPGTNGASGACTVGNSDAGEASVEELAEGNGVDTGDKESGERESGERESGEVGEVGGIPREIRVRILRASRAAKFRHDPAWSSRWCLRLWQ